MDTQHLVADWKGGKKSYEKCKKSLEKVRETPYKENTRETTAIENSSTVEYMHRGEGCS